MAQMSSHLYRVRDQKEMQHLRKCWIPLKEAQLQANPWQESSIFLWMIFLEHVELRWNKRVLARFRKDIQVGSEDWNDVLFTGQRIRWMKDHQLGPSIEVSQERAIEELEEIPIEKNTKDLYCTQRMHTKYRSLLGQINLVTK